MNVTIKEEERQTTLLALAELSLRRPGWLNHIERIADKFSGREMFDGFRETSADLAMAIDNRCGERKGHAGPCKPKRVHGVGIGEALEMSDTAFICQKMLKSSKPIFRSAEEIARYNQTGIDP